MRYHTRRRARQAADKTKTGGDTATKKRQRRSPQKTAIIRLTNPVIFSRRRQNRGAGNRQQAFPRPRSPCIQKIQRRCGARNGNKPFCRLTGANGEQPEQTQGRDCRQVVFAGCRRTAKQKQPFTRSQTGIRPIRYRKTAGTRSAAWQSIQTGCNIRHILI